ncbi:uncharacterized protein LOC132279724 [Cornus florida]|uniref:uncharacterized protein LOC132279724 n=1 Tax=Cornus florida TaxID=4283 RepID=UPI002897CBE3|nr:uncharacterized protein LOC132279724 [Cornus florida]
MTINLYHRVDEEGSLSLVSYSPFSCSAQRLIREFRPSIPVATPPDPPPFILFPLANPNTNCHRRPRSRSNYTAHRCKTLSTQNLHHRLLQTPRSCRERNREMAVVERIRKADVRVFEWDERIFKNEGSESEGMLMIRVSTDVLVGEVKIDLRVNKDILLPFRLDNLFPRESLESMFDLPTQSQNIFLLDTNDRILSAHLIKYLVSNFQFTTTVNSFPSRKSKIVVVVDIFAESTSVFKTTSSQDFRNEEEEEEEEEYGNVEDEEQDMVSSTENEEDDEDMNYDSTDLNVEEEHEVDCVDDLVGQEFEDEEEDLMDYNNNASDMVDEESHYAEVPRNDHLEILSTLRDDESIPRDEPIFLFKEIETAVKVNRLNEYHTSLSVDNCSICLQRFLTGTEIATTPCSHIFHHDCLRTWLPKNNSCPMCRSLCATIVHV